MQEIQGVESHGLSSEQIGKLQQLALQSDILLSVARAHAALLLASHVLKWLSAILGTILLLKGFLPW